MRRGWCAWVVIAVACTVSPVGSAREPSLWDAAREPRLVRDIEALRSAERSFLRAHSNGSRARIFHEEAARILDRVDAATSPDPRVRFFFGRALARIGQDERAGTVLRQAIEYAPNHPGVVEATFTLAVSLARLGRTQEEILAYQDWLQLESSPEHRAVGLSNLAESFMAAGRLDDAVRCYREAIGLVQDNALAHWGLAVALDRSGDLAGALRVASTALTYDPDAAQLDSPHVFFIPPHERFWYDALGAMARASTTSDLIMSGLWWNRATSSWKRYLDAAEVDDRWLPIAKVRYAFCEQRAKEANHRIQRKKD